MELHRIIKRYLVTEKSTFHKEETNKYTFQVDRSANKIEIKNAIQNLFKVKVIDIHVISVPGQKKRVGRIVGEISPWKKAVVTLAKDNRIDIVEGI